jgi:hypothetical protein
MAVEFQQFGKILIIGGIILIAAGFLFFFSDKIPFIGRLPGDIIIKKKNFTFYFPIVTSIISKLNNKPDYLFFQKIKKLTFRGNQLLLYFNFSKG